MTRMSHSTGLWRRRSAAGVDLLTGKRPLPPFLKSDEEAGLTTAALFEKGGRGRLPDKPPTRVIFGQLP